MKKNNLQAAAVFLLIFLIIFNWALDKRQENNLDLHMIELNKTLESYKVNLQAVDSEQAEVIEGLKSNLTDHEKRIVINLEELENLETELQNIRIEFDEMSEQSMIYLFNEVWEEIELIRKAIK